MSTDPGGPVRDHTVREAAEADLDALVDFEILIARISFDDEAVTDRDFHRRRIAKSLGQPGEVTLVAVPVDDPAHVAGWAWMSLRTNSVSGARYGNFRSLAVEDGATQAGELLLGAVIERADVAGLDELVGKVHARNLNMRTLYRKFGFDVVHLSMHRRRTAG